MLQRNQASIIQRPISRPGVTDKQIQLPHFPAGPSPEAQEAVHFVKLGQAQIFQSLLVDVAVIHRAIDDALVCFRIDELGLEQIQQLVIGDLGFF